MHRSPRCSTEKFNSSRAADLGALHRRESFKCNEDLNLTLLGWIWNLKTGFAATLNNRCA